MSPERFSMVDVFSDVPFRGNPLAVWHADVEPDDDVIQAYARWTNLSESTVLLPARHPEADYRVRILTPREELPFAGHPTLGTCAAWLAAGGVPRNRHEVVQECPAGLVRIRREGDRLAFAAPPLTRFGEPSPTELGRALAALKLKAGDVVDASWVVNGPQWLGLLLPSAEAVLALRPPAPGDLEDMEIGVIGPCPEGAETAYEVRAFCPEIGVGEDPVTGSLNAGLAQWLIRAGRAPSRYTVSQGTALQRRGRLTLSLEGDDVWVSGATAVRASGTLTV